MKSLFRNSLSERIVIRTHPFAIRPMKAMMMQQIAKGKSAVGGEIIFSVML